jgi:tetratricopeptide (TPR) repeat protein
MRGILKSFYSARVIIFLMGVIFGQMEMVFARTLESFRHYFEVKKKQEIFTKESPHFSAQWANPRDALLADALLQYMEAARQELKSSFGMVIDEKKVPVEIYPDLKSFSEVSGLSLARFRATGTIALTLDQRLMILSPRNLTSGYSWAETAVHEYIHYLIREISPDLIPIWLHEGAAQLFQSYPFDRNPQLKPSQWGLFKKRQESGKLLNLRTLQEPFPMRETPEEAELAYIQAFLFVRWLNESCGVVSLIRNIEKLKSVDRGLEACVGKKMSELEKDFIPKIMSQVRIPDGKEIEWFAKDFSNRDPMEQEGVRADQRARNFAQLSTELYRQGRYRAASLEMEKAFAQTPVAPPSWRRHMALSLREAGQGLEAQKVLSQLVNDYPEDAAAWYLLGLEQVARGQWSKAWDKFLKAFYRNPFLDGLENQMDTLKMRQPELKDRYLFKDM